MNGATDKVHGKVARLVKLQLCIDRLVRAEPCQTGVQYSATVASECIAKQ